MYETMRVWDTLDDPEPVMQDYAGIWRGIDKVVFSRTLDGVTTERTRLEREFDPGTVRALRDGSERDLAVAGPDLAAAAFAAGLVDECHLFVVPVIVGGGHRALPDGVRLDLELTAERRFASGFVYLAYEVRSS